MRLPILLTAFAIMLPASGDAIRAQDDLIPITGKAQTATEWIRPGARNGGYDELAAPGNIDGGKLEDLPIGIPSEGPGSLTNNLEVIIQRYTDGKIQIKRHVVQDDQGNYLNHGLWQLFNQQGQVVAEGNFNRGKMQGDWQRWHPADSQGIFSSSPFDQFTAPFLSVGQFDGGHLHGLWTVYDRQRRKIVEIPYSGGQRNGTAIWFWPDGQRMQQISFQNGNLDGELIQWDRQSKETRREQFTNGRRMTREVSYWHQDQKKNEDHYLDRTLLISEEDDWWEATPAEYHQEGSRSRHGISLAWYENGQPRLRGYYENDLRHGWFTAWHTNGQKEVNGLFQNGLKEGAWIWWHANGMKCIQGRYENDRPVGVWTWWDESGSLLREENFSELPPPDDWYVPDPTELPPPDSIREDNGNDDIQLDGPQNERLDKITRRRSRSLGR